MRKFKRLTLTLALLITAAGGAWADGTVYNTTVALKDLKAGDVLTDGFKLTPEKGQYIYVKGYKKDGGTAETSDYTQLNADNSTFPGGVTISESGSTYTPYADGKDANAWIVSDWKDLGSATMLYLDGYNYTPTEWSLTPDQTGKKWTLDKMPASNIELQVEYFAESNLFLSKDALADKTNIAVTAGKDPVTFGDDGKSANTVTEGTEMTVKFNGTKKLLGMKVEKKAPTLLSIQIDGHVTATIYYFEGETWEQALQNHPTENSSWKIDQGYMSNQGMLLFKDDDFVNSTDTIAPNAGYTFQWT